MSKNKILIYSMVLISGLILVWMVDADQGIKPIIESAEEETPLIIVDGKVAPRLPKFVAHMEFIDEKTCLQCHANEREMNFGSGPVLVKKMPHEYRENCVSCHILPA